MDVFAMLESCNQSGVARQMSEDPQIDLRIVGRQQHVIGLCHERPPDAAACLAAGWNILQVRIARAQPAGSRDRLMKGGMDPAGRRIDQLTERIRVGRLKFGQHPEFQQPPWQRMGAGQFLERIRIGRVPALALLDSFNREFQFGEQNLPQLDGRVEIKLAARCLVTIHLQPCQFLAEFVRDALERRRVYANSAGLHLCQDHCDWHLDFVEQFLQALGGQLGRERVVQRRDDLGLRQ